MEPVLFYDMFPFLFGADRLFSDFTTAKVVSATINKQSSTMELTVSLFSPVPPTELRTIEDSIARKYGLSKVNINATYARPSVSSKSASQNEAQPAKSGTVILGQKVNITPTPMDQITLDMGKVAVSGEVCDVSSKFIEKSKAWVLAFDLTDFSGTIHVSKFMTETNAPRIVKKIKPGMSLFVSGTLSFSRYDGDLVLEPLNIIVTEREEKIDNAPQKRVELHLHTKMSAMDATTSVSDVISRAVKWGHPAIAITDHGVVQSFPDASAAAAKAKGKIKIIYGLEGYFRNHVEETPVGSEPGDKKAAKKARVKNRHIILLARNQTGLRNLYKLVTISHLDDFDRFPIIHRRVLDQHRDGLIVGSACEAGELFDAVVHRAPKEELIKIAEFYDYLEIQPVCNNMFMLYSEPPLAKDIDELRSFNTTIYELGKELGKPVVATGDVHFLEPQDEIYRKILLTSKGFSSADDDLPLYYKTTEEMLEEFAYLGEDAAYEVVVENSLKIADMCEKVNPLPPKNKLFVPKLENSSDELKSLVSNKMKELYGETPPEIVTTRAQTELSDILDRDYDVIYMAAQKLVANSLKHGYLVGSRGSVGSSLIAFLAGITEVNSLPAHYRCPNCRKADFKSGANFGCGADMPDANCPECGSVYIKDGFNIPFETFLGFGGDKVPDIDLNFSGEYQAEAHKQTIELFGSDNVYRAGTIGKVAEKTAYGYAKSYLEKIGKTVTKAEENRLSRGCIDVRRTTGQHPGGLIIIPQGMSITDFCPAQHPADSRDAGVITTHFDYHCMEDNLIKLDALGHDDPTMIKMLEDSTGVNATEIKLDDPDTLSLFTSPTLLGVPDNDKIIGESGTIGIPEFGTPLTRQMLVDTKPTNFDTLVRLSGYSHGTDVWIGNAKDLILSGKATVGETISCRDDIMLFLISKGMEDVQAFKVSESVRKGKGLPDETEAEMIKLGVPDWYIESCKKIKYLFPKAHAVAYVIMAFRIAWFKVHKPLEFYSAYFYRRSQKDGFDAECMTRGKNVALAKIKEIKNKPDAKQKDEDLLITLEACYEFYLRGYDFANIDIYESDPVKFLIMSEEKKLRPPFVSISGLGETAARDIASKREGQEFISIEEISTVCSKVSKTHFEQLKALGALRDLPQSSQMSLF